MAVEWTPEEGDKDNKKIDLSLKGSDSKELEPDSQTEKKEWKFLYNIEIWHKRCVSRNQKTTTQTNVDDTKNNLKKSPNDKKSESPSTKISKFFDTTVSPMIPALKSPKGEKENSTIGKKIQHVTYSSNPTVLTRVRSKSHSSSNSSPPTTPTSATLHANRGSERGSERGSDRGRDKNEEGMNGKEISPGESQSVHGTYSPNPTTTSFSTSTPSSPFPFPSPLGFTRNGQRRSLSGEISSKNFNIFHMNMKNSNIVQSPTPTTTTTSNTTSNTTSSINNNVNNTMSYGLSMSSPVTPTGYSSPLSPKSPPKTSRSLLFRSSVPTVLSHSSTEHTQL